ncbi:MAG: hypothetical protein HS116_08115 [Planctomycetes bacterium]|nr:hypothetical protein [Planctomycetota bacterium]
MGETTENPSPASAPRTDKRSVKPSTAPPSPDNRFPASTPPFTRAVGIFIIFCALGVCGFALYTQQWFHGAAVLVGGGFLGLRLSGRLPKRKA